MHFTKMQGIGNDYVYVNGFAEKVRDPERTAVRVSDRHFGVGGDGLIIIAPSEKADCAMQMYNADGSAGKMCGNGIRCVAKYVCDHGMVSGNDLTVETLSGVKKIHVEKGPDGKVVTATVDMGAPVLRPSEIPVLFRRSGSAEKIPLVFDGPAEGPLTGGLLTLSDGTETRVTCVSMGNPHCVIFTDTPVKELKLMEIGPMYEHAAAFPERINTEFVNVLSRTHVRMRVWERGSGETLACGTGACAVTAAAVLAEKTERRITVSLPGGDLAVHWDETSGHILMTGPAVTVFEGEINDEN